MSHKSRSSVPRLSDRDLYHSDTKRPIDIRVAMLVSAPPLPSISTDDEPCYLPMAMQNQIRAVVYCRYSSAQQNERSIEDQLELCRRLIEREGWTLLRSYE